MKNKRIIVDLKEICEKIIDNRNIKTNGGAGSGNWGHAGRKGKVGGSAPENEEGVTDKKERSIRRLKELVNNFGANNLVKKAVEKIHNQRFVKIWEKIQEYRKISKKNKERNNIKNIEEIREYLKNQGIEFTADSMDNIDKILVIIEQIDKFEEDTGMKIDKLSFGEEDETAFALFIYEENLNKIGFNKYYNKRGHPYKGIEEWKSEIKNYEKEKKYWERLYYNILKNTKDKSDYEEIGYDIYDISGDLALPKKTTILEVRDKFKKYIKDCEDRIQNVEDTLSYRYLFTVAGTNNSDIERYRLVVNHELGHCLMRNTYIAFKKNNPSSDIREFSNLMYPNIYKNYYDNYKKKQISKYGSKNLKEFFAENYSLYKYKPEEVEKEIKEDFKRMEEYLKEHKK